MTMLLILGAGLAAFAIFIAGCFVGHRTGRNEGSDSANRWEDHYRRGDMERASAAFMGEHVPQSPPAPPMPPRRPVGPETRIVKTSDLRKPADDDTMRKMAAAHMERVMTKEGWDL